MRPFEISKTAVRLQSSHVSFGCYTEYTSIISVASLDKSIFAMDIQHNFFEVGQIIFLHISRFGVNKIKNASENIKSSSQIASLSVSRSMLIQHSTCRSAGQRSNTRY
jgi:hypothetical protein